MTYLLDTNVCVLHLAGRSAKIQQRLQTIPASEIALCSVVKAEIFYGVMKSNSPQQSLALRQRFLSQFVSLPFDDLAAEFYGRERARLAKLGTPIGPNDLMIAAIALANSLTLITHNTREFGRIVGLQFEDWEI